MSVWTDWLLAEEDEAEAVASILTTEERSFEDWPHLTLEGIGILELQHLASALHSDGTAPAALGDLLFQGSEEGPFVALLAEDFALRLATTPDSAIPAIAAAWHRSEHLAPLPLSKLEQVLREIVAFARRSRDTGTPILQLMTMSC
jgi:hypothetical protein